MVLPWARTLIRVYGTINIIIPENTCQEAVIGFPNQIPHNILVYKNRIRYTVQIGIVDEFGFGDRLDPKHTSQLIIAFFTVSYKYKIVLWIIGNHGGILNVILKLQLFRG